MNTKVRVLLADGQQKVRSALRLLLEQDDRINVVGEAGDVAGLLIQIQVICPDLLLLDWDLPGMPVTALLLVLQETCADLRVIALSGRPELRSQALKAGVDDFISKVDPPEHLLAVVFNRKEKDDETQ